MAWYDPRHILALLKRTTIPVVVDGEINPTLEAIAKRGYWVQSRVLRIPDRFGLLSPGPPLLQAFQAQNLYSIATEAILPVICAFTMDIMALETGWFPGLMAAACVLFIVSIYIYVGEIFSNPMRASDYDWRALHEKMGLVQPAA